MKPIKEMTDQELEASIEASRKSIADAHAAYEAQIARGNSLYLEQQRRCQHVFEIRGPFDVCKKCGWMIQ